MASHEPSGDPGCPRIYGRERVADIILVAPPFLDSAHATP